MPSHSKRASIQSDTRASPDNLLLEEAVPEKAKTGSAGKKKRSKHARPPPPAEEQRVSPLRRQIPRSFPSARRREPSPPAAAAAEDGSPDGNEPETVPDKGSDKYSPRQETSDPPAPYARFAQLDLLDPHAPPPALAQPSHLESGRGGFSSRTPPVSPPLAKARPVSFGGRPTSQCAPRTSPSHYNPYLAPAYGSPPTLPPHMPQQHFYQPQDVDLGLGPSATAPARTPILIKASSLSQPGAQDPKSVLLGYFGQLDVLTHTDRSLELTGSLRKLPGSVLDAVFLTWNEGADPFRDLRPLVAITLCLHHDAHDSPLAHPAAAYRPDSGQSYTLAVAIYSLKQQILVADLLTLPDQVPEEPLSYAHISFAAQPRLQAHGNFLALAFPISGELFVFSPKASANPSTFVCLTKVWTAVQPQLPRRESMPVKSRDFDYSAPDSSRSGQLRAQPIFCLNGRWLAYCPAPPDVQPLGLVLGESIAAHGTPTASSSSPSGRPSVTCSIDSPDTPTLLGRAAKGAAQGILRGAEIAREKSIQLWREYWNPEAQSSVGLASRPTSITGRRPVDNFPPTHADPPSTENAEPEVVAILDLKPLQDVDSAAMVDSVTPAAVFQPIGGCSYLSFMPSGLGLLTASRKGDVQYVWDLFQMKYLRAAILPPDHEVGQLAANVRQIAKYERVSPSVIIDLEWDTLTGSKFAVLTQNRTIHLYDLPPAALRWPPQRRPVTKPRAASETVEKASAPVPATSVASGFFASARALASSTQPMLASLRNRAPSASGPEAGTVATSSLGYASATGLRSSKAMAVGLSKSLGAANDAVAQIRHAGQSRIHLTWNALPGRMAWLFKDDKTALTLLDSNGERRYTIRKTNPRERQAHTVSVFSADRPVGIRFPANTATASQAEPPVASGSAGFWKLQSSTKRVPEALTAPLGQAEIETSAPYQPFHSDRRITISVFTPGHGQDKVGRFTASAVPSSHEAAIDGAKWVFGGQIPTAQVSLGHVHKDGYDPATSTIYREMTTSLSVGGHETQQLCSSTSTKRRTKRLTLDDAEDDEDNAVEHWRDIRRHNLRQMRKQIRSIVLLMSLLEAIRVGPVQLVFAGKLGYPPPSDDDHGIAYTMGYIISWLYMCLFSVLFVPLFSWWLPTPAPGSHSEKSMHAVSCTLKKLNLIVLPLIVDICLVQYIFYTIHTFVYIDSRPKGSWKLPKNSKKNWFNRLLLVAGVAFSTAFGFYAIAVLGQMGLATVKPAEYFAIALPVQVNIGVLIGSAFQYKIEKRMQRKEALKAATPASSLEEGYLDEKTPLLD
ncbi:hypothetical protein DV735_g5183, partial [Chaetothyriales sp. CBS 134920]